MGHAKGNSTSRAHVGACRQTCCTANAGLFMDQAMILVHSCIKMQRNRGISARPQTGLCTSMRHRRRFYG